MRVLQKPSEDCVSREQAIKELKESAEHHANDTREEVLLRRDRDIIRALPPVTPTQSWIPVSERLPEEETTVLICTDQGDIDASRIFSYSDGTREWFASSWCYGEIIAWMPLPEPYIESEDME